MNKIEFEITKETTGGDGEYDGVVINVDDESLLKKAEAAQPPTFAYQSLTSFVSQMNKKKNPKKVYIFTCLCGDDECGGLECTVERKDDEVIFKDFGENSPFLDYSVMGEYHFDKQQFDKEVEKLKALLIAKSEEEHKAYE